MPKNMNLEPIKLPMDLKFDEKAQTEFFEIEENIEVSLIQGPKIEDLLNYIPQFVNATWEEAFKPEEYMRKERWTAVIKAFSRKTLPTVMEIPRFTFLVEGLTYVEVSHILRHRGFSLSAKCSGDTHLHDTPVMIPESIKNSKEFNKRYREINKLQKELYADMVNSKKISSMDARYALPVSRAQGYYISCDIQDLIAFIYQRIDRAIQPKSDNIIAYQMWIEACKQVPLLAALEIVDFDAPSRVFIDMARQSNTTNLYWPEEHNDKFDWHPHDFIYQGYRDDIAGTDNIPSKFPQILQKYKDKLNEIKIEFENQFPEVKDLIEEINGSKK